MNKTTMARTLIEMKLGENLDAYLDTRRERKMSWQKIAEEIHERTSLRVTGETLRIWHNTEVAA